MLHPVEKINNVQMVHTPYNFVKGIEQAGGTPIVLPIADLKHIKTYADCIDGLLLTGGQDIAPRFYNEEPIPELRETLPIRDTFELTLIEEMTRQKKPIFGICRGLQIINVANGGTLYQDIDSQAGMSIKHAQATLPHFVEHSIITKENSLIRQILGKKAYVNTLHHQAIKDLAPNLIATATSPDGFIEAIESNDDDHVIMAVQWHPETLLDSNNKEDALALFKNFVDRCTTSKKERHR